MKTVIDTDVLVSAIFFGGKPKQIMEMLIGGQIEVYATKEILSEYRETTDFLQRKYSRASGNPALSYIMERLRIIEAKTRIAVCRDSDDDKFIGCAVDAGCSHLISGDKDLLELENYDGIEIVTASEFLEKFMMVG